MVKSSTKLTANLARRWCGRLVLPLLAVALVALPGIGHSHAAAPNTTHLTSMAISVMPEYDQARVLVSYRGEFAKDVSLPFETRLRLPADATIEHVCSLKPDEEHICQPYTTDPDGQYLTVTWEAITPIMYVEFYYGSISGAGKRSLDFTFMPPYPVKNLDLFVLEPAAATDFRLAPAPADTVEDQGFMHHSYSYKNLPADEPVSIEMNYVRQTSEPSAPPRTASSADSGGTPTGLLLALGLAGAVVLALVPGSVFYRRRRARAVAHAHPSPGGTGAAPEGGTFFCRHCGQVVRPGSAFCPGCGHQAKPPPGEQE